MVWRIRTILFSQMLEFMFFFLILCALPSVFCCSFFSSTSSFIFHFFFVLGSCEHEREPPFQYHLGIEGTAVRRKWQDLAVQQPSSSSF